MTKWSVKFRGREPITAQLEGQIDLDPVMVTWPTIGLAAGYGQTFCKLDAKTGSSRLVGAVELWDETGLPS